MRNVLSVLILLVATSYATAQCNVQQNQQAQVSQAQILQQLAAIQAQQQPAIITQPTISTATASRIGQTAPRERIDFVSFNPVSSADMSRYVSQSQSSDFGALERLRDIANRFDRSQAAQVQAQAPPQPVAVAPPILLAPQPAVTATATVSGQGVRQRQGLIRRILPPKQVAITKRNGTAIAVNRQ